MGLTLDLHLAFIFLGSHVEGCCFLEHYHHLWRYSVLISLRLNGRGRYRSHICICQRLETLGSFHCNIYGHSYRMYFNFVEPTKNTFSCTNIDSLSFLAGNSHDVAVVDLCHLFLLWQRDALTNCGRPTRL
jgi:hypothetical protein